MKKSHPLSFSPGLFKLLVLPAFLTALVLFSCNSSDKGDADSDINVATSFIQSALKSDFKTARKYMVADSINLGFLSAIEENNSKMSNEEKERYKGASIRIHDHRLQNDSTSIIVFSNSYKDIMDSLKVIRRDGQWKVDFKYLLHHKTDSLPPTYLP